MFLFHVLYNILFQIVVSFRIVVPKCSARYAQFWFLGMCVLHWRERERDFDWLIDLIAQNMCIHHINKLIVIERFTAKIRWIKCKVQWRIVNCKICSDINVDQTVFYLGIIVPWAFFVSHSFSKVEITLWRISTTFANIKSPSFL